jgi:hypothetical protein
LPRWVYFWLVSAVSRRVGDEWHWRNTDDRDNERGVPPADEHVRWHALWLAEVYLPSTIGGLIDGIERLGWWESHKDETVRDAVNAGRSGRGGGSVVLPLLHRRTRRGIFRMTSWDRDLPDGVEYVTGHISYLTPSATVLIVGFRFADSLSAEIDQSLRRTYRTFHKRTGWYSSRVMTPDFQRRDAVRAIEKRVMRDARTWVSDRMPGYFATDILSAAPATFLVTTQKSLPFVRTKEDHWWMSQAGIEHSWNKWTTGIKDLHLYSRPRDDGPDVLAGRQSDIFSDADYWKTFGHEDVMWSLQYEIDTELGEVFALLALDGVLRDGRRRLGALRDSLAQTSASSSRQQLKSVKAQLGTMSSDLTSLTDEVERWPEDRDFVLRNVPEMTNLGRGGDAKLLGDRLVDWYAEDGRRVRAFEAATRSLLVATAEIAAALENINLQRFVKWVSVLALIVALVALAVAGAGVAHDLGWLPGPTPSPIH